MLIFGRIGQTVRIHYNERVAPTMPYHGRYGKLVVLSNGKPRNHGVEIDGKIVVVPCGNIIAVK